jgi:hypothetical protein
MCPDEYFNHPQENTYGSGVSNRDWSYDGNSEDDSGEKDNKSHSDSSNLQSTKTSNSSSATSSSSSSASSSASSASSTAASSTATSTATTAVGGAVTGGAVTAIVVAVVVVVAPALSNKPALSDINVDMTGTVLSYSFNAQYSASNVLHLSLLNLDSSFHQDYDLAVPGSASSSEASVKPVYRIAASSSENSSVTSAESSSSAAPVYSKLIQGYFDQLAEGAAYTFKITTDTSVGETTLYSTSISAASAEETKKATPVFFDTTVTPLDTSASFSCDVGYFQECSLVVSLSNGDTTAASQTTPLPRDSAHLIPGVSGSAAYDATITGTFSNLTPGTPYIAHISVRSPTFPETKHDPIPASTLAFHDAKIESSSLTATDTALTYAYSFSYVEATTLDILYGSAKKTYTLALDAAKKTAAVDVSNRPIYQDSISGSFSGLTPNTPQNFVIHAKSDHTDKDILSKSVSTLAFYAPNFSVVTSKPLDTSYVYSYAFKYVEETALTVDLNGTKQAYTLALDSTHATTEKDPSGKTIYAYTASSSFTGLSPATSYPLKITASSALFPEASLHDETIKTNAFTKPDLAIASVTPSDSNILCGFTMTYVETTTVVVSDGTDSETMEFAYDGSATGSTDQNERVLNTIQFQKDFTGLTKKQTYPITLTVSSAHVPSFLLYSSSALATGELTTPAIVSSTSTPSPTSVAFTYHLRYIRETTAIVSLDTTRQSFVIPLENANKRIGSLDEYGNTYYESDISGTFEGLPSGTTYILKIDMSDATYPLNTVATTSIETTEIPTVVSPVLTCPSNDLSYQFTIRYIEEVDLTAKASGGKDERETGFTCGLDEQYKTSDTDSHGNSIYQQTIKGTWRYLYTSTAYAVQLTASSTHYSHAIIYSGNITTGTDTAPSISGTASVDYATSTASLTLTFSDPNNHIQTASGFYVVLVGKTTKTTAGTDETISNGVLTKKIVLTAPYTSVQSLDLSEFTKGYSIRCSIYGTSDQGTAGSPNRISTDPVILGELALYY